MILKKEEGKFVIEGTTTHMKELQEDLQRLQNETCMLNTSVDNLLELFNDEFGETEDV